MQSKESRSEQNRSMSAERTKANTRWYVINLSTSSGGEKKGNRQLLGHMGYLPDRLCANIAFWNNPSENERREVFLADLFYLLIH